MVYVLKPNKKYNSCNCFKCIWCKIIFKKIIKRRAAFHVPHTSLGRGHLLFPHPSPGSTFGADHGEHWDTPGCCPGNAGLAFQDPAGFQGSLPSWAMDSTLKILRKLLSAHPCGHYRARSWKKPLCNPDLGRTKKRYLQWTCTELGCSSATSSAEETVLLH